MENPNIDYVSPTLKFAIDSFIERMDMDRRDCEIFYDIIGFAYHEGKIRGKEEILLGEETKTEING
jgi:hypothetical protein